MLIRRQPGITTRKDWASCLATSPAFSKLVAPDQMLFVLTLSWRRFVVAKRRRICRQGRGCISVSCAVSTPVLVTNLGHVSYREGDHFHFSQQIFIFAREGARRRTTVEQLFTRQNFLCPAMGLWCSDIHSSLHSHSSYRSVQKRMSTPRQRQTAAECDGVGVCNTSRREARSSLLLG